MPVIPRKEREIAAYRMMTHLFLMGNVKETMTDFAMDLSPGEPFDGGDIMLPVLRYGFRDFARYRTPLEIEINYNRVAQGEALAFMFKAVGMTEIIDLSQGWRPLLGIVGLLAYRVKHLTKFGAGE